MKHPVLQKGQYCRIATFWHAPNFCDLAIIAIIAKNSCMWPKFSYIVCKLLDPKIENFSCCKMFLFYSLFLAYQLPHATHDVGSLVWGPLCALSLSQISMYRHNLQWMCKGKGILHPTVSSHNSYAGIREMKEMPFTHTAENYKMIRSCPAHPSGQVQFMAHLKQLTSTNIGSMFLCMSFAKVFRSFPSSAGQGWHIGGILLSTKNRYSLSPPVHIARWAHMHRFPSVCPSVCLSHF